MENTIIAWLASPPVMAGWNVLVCLAIGVGIAWVLTYFFPEDIFYDSSD